MNFIGAFFIVMVFLFIGEWASKLSNTFVPSVFVSAILFTIGFWTFLPKDIVVQASYNNAFINICIAILLVHLGTLMSLKELLQQWRAVCIALLGVCGTMLMCLLVGTLFFEWKSVLTVIPPLTGGLISALLMTNGLKAQGETALLALPVSMFVIHSVIGYPLTSFMLHCEGNRLVKELKAGGHALQKKYQSGSQVNSKNLKSQSHTIFNIKSEYNTASFILVRVAAVALLGTWFSGIINNIVNPNIICLIFGVIAHQLGLLENNALNKAGVFNWLMYGLLAYMLSQLSVTTPSIMGRIVIQIIVLIFLGLLGMFITSFVLSKPFKMSWQMAYACSLTSLFGFPADFILTSEVVKSIAKNKEEESYLFHQMMPKMLVGGFATVTIASVIIASIFLKLI